MLAPTMWNAPFVGRMAAPAAYFTDGSGNGFLPQKRSVILSAAKNPLSMRKGNGSFDSRWSLRMTAVKKIPPVPDGTGGVALINP